MSYLCERCACGVVADRERGEGGVDGYGAGECVAWGDAQVDVHVRVGVGFPPRIVAGLVAFVGAV